MQDEILTKLAKRRYNDTCLPGTQDFEADSWDDLSQERKDHYLKEVMGTWRYCDTMYRAHLIRAVGMLGWCKEKFAENGMQVQANILEGILNEFDGKKAKGFGR